MSTIVVGTPPSSGDVPVATGESVLDAARVYVARQPVLDRDAMLCGFELAVSPVMLPATAPDAASPSTASAAKTEFAPRPLPPLVRGLRDASLHDALIGHPASVDVTREFVCSGAIEMIPPQRFVFELPPDIAVDQDLIARLVSLHGRRYRFALDHVTQADDTFGRLLPYCQTVKIDVPRAKPGLLPKLVFALRPAGKKLVAIGLDRQQDFDAALAMSFERYQGYFFATATASSKRRSSAPRQALLRLLKLLASELTVSQLEDELKQNPLLVMHLMKLAATSGLETGRSITTLREAINATGTNRIARWTQLLLYADGRKVAIEADPLLQLAATRARFIELAAARLPHAGHDDRDGAFLTGVFSFVDAVFGGGLESTLDVLTLAKPIRAAIVRREGVLGRLLSAIEALERGEWATVDALASQLAPLTSPELASLALSAAAWAGVADRHAEADGLERIED